MKVGAVALPVVVVALIFALVLGISMAMLKAGSTAVNGGLELVRLQLRVVRMQQEVLQLSRQSLERQLAELDALAARAVSRSPDATVPDDPGAGAIEVDGDRETGPRREWPWVEPQPGSTPISDR
jgi:hypothetical protein